MDSNFLEFWGNFLLSAARNQKQMEDMQKWMQQGFRGFEDITALFRKIYGVKPSGEACFDYGEFWKKAQADFTESFKDYLNLLGVVPRDEYLALVKKYEELKERVSSQEETIKHLRMLFTNVKEADYERVSRKFDNLLQKQGEQFQQLMDNFSSMFTDDASTGVAGEY